jgi:hypothetical protein
VYVLSANRGASPGDDQLGRSGVEVLAREVDGAGLFVVAGRGIVIGSI